MTNAWKAIVRITLILLTFIGFVSIACSTTQDFISNNAVPTVSQNSMNAIVAQTAAAAATQTAQQIYLSTATPTNTFVTGESSPEYLSSSATPIWINGFEIGNPTATPLGSDITDPNFIKGVEAFNADDDQDAISLMTEVITADPNLAPPYRYRATAYWSLKNCASGWTDIEKALSINPNYAAAWVTHGLLEECTGNGQQAIEDYQKAISIDPSLAFAHQNLAVSYYHQGDYESALQEYSIAALIDPTRSGAWSGEAEALGQLGQYVECIQDATTALQVNPEETLAYSDRAFCELQMDNYSASAADYQNYVARYPSDSGAWYNLLTFTKVG